MDEVSLALIADAWSRTYRSKTVSFATSAGAVETANGMRIIPDQVTTTWPAEQRVSTFPDRRPAQALDLVLAAIAGHYGEPTARVVAMQLEYPWTEGVR